MVPFGILLSVLGKKVIYDIHENTHDDILLKPWLSPRIRKFLASLYNGMLWLGSKFMHYIVVLGDPIYLPKFFVNDGNSTIIQNFADVDELEPFLVNNRGDLPDNHLFYVGMIRDMYYNIDPVLEALYLLKQKGVICHLHLIGYFGSKTSKSFENLSFWGQIQNQVTYYGFLEMKEAYEISKKCKIGLCIKNQPEQMLVSHERKLFEYMAIGLPSIFCGQTIYSNLNRTHQLGLTVDLENAQSISNAIFELLNNPELLNSLSRSNILASRNQINWKTELEKLRKLYLHLSIS
jgi:glycosyltransferase involved in cell wall biosynthesis